MTDRPIIFSAPMVQALLAGRKTQTRRLAYRQVVTHPDCPKSWLLGIHGGDGYTLLETPWMKAKPGDRLWVRESGIQSRCMTDDGWTGLFRHDVPETPEQGRYWVESSLGTGAAYSVAGCSRKAALASADAKVRPSIHMPRWASRLTLLVTDVRVERLRDISEEDAIAEGVETPSDDRDERDWKICPKCGGTGLHGALGEGLGYCEIDCYECDTHLKRFQHLWNSIHGSDAWAANPWIVAVTFDVHRFNIDALPQPAEEKPHE